MRFSVWPGLHQPVAEVLEVARHAEATGWDGIWVADHFMPNEGAGPRDGPMHEATAVLAALAVAVPRVRIGSLVLGGTYRHPAVVANWAATVDHLSGGRLVLGIGAGWQVNEHEAYGIDLPPVRALIDRFDESCQAILGLLRTPTTTLAGTHVQLTDAVCEPKPVQERLPLLIGAAGEQRMLRLVARHADEWNCWGLPDRIAAKAAVLDRHCETEGRDPATIARSCQALLYPTDDPARATAFLERNGGARAAAAGSLDELTEVVGAWRDAGVDELVVPDFTLGRGSRRTDHLDALIGHLGPLFA